MHKKNVRNRYVSFYYVSKKGEVPCRVYTIKEWQRFFDYNRIRQLKRSRSTMESHETNVTDQSTIQRHEKKVSN